MSKLYNLYENKLDKAWYDSTNIVYSECDDNLNALKTVRITFKNGTVYEYSDVNVNDYLLFRESISTGKAFVKYLKKYDCKKLENVDIDSINEEYKKIIEENTEQNEQNQ